MTHDNQSKNKHEQKHEGLNFQGYLSSSDEPLDIASHDTHTELEIELLENSYFMRRRLRHNARRMRNYYR